MMTPPHLRSLHCCHPLLPDVFFSRRRVNFVFIWRIALRDGSRFPSGNEFIVGVPLRRVLQINPKPTCSGKQPLAISEKWLMQGCVCVCLFRAPQNVPFGPPFKPRKKGTEPREKTFSYGAHVQTRLLLWEEKIHTEPQPFRHTT